MNNLSAEARLQKITQLILRILPKYPKIEKVIREMGVRSDGLWKYRYVDHLLVAKHRDMSPHEYPIFYIRHPNEKQLIIYVNLNGWIVQKISYTAGDAVVSIQDYHPERLEEDITVMGKAFLRNGGLMTSMLINILTCLQFWSMNKAQRQKANRR